MIVSIMQPYFLPYIGYFQLIDKCDTFVVLDDVNYINRGWINRNRILINGKIQYITIPLVGASQNKLINEILIQNSTNWKAKLMKTIEMAYKKSISFENGLQVFEKIINYDEDNLSKFLTNSIVEIINFLDVDTQIIKSSSVFPKNGLKGEHRILDICKQLNADQYINPIGGIELYHKEVFEQENIKLNFIKTIPMPYEQIKINEFEFGLSMLDVIMNNDTQNIKKQLLNVGII